MRKRPNQPEGSETERSGQVFVSDTTYVETDDGIHRLSPVTDACSRRITGYGLSDNMRAESVVKALRRAVKRRRTRKPPIRHSDGGPLQFHDLPGGTEAAQYRTVNDGWL